MNYFLELFEKYPEAEGIDFVPISVGPIRKICQTNWKKDFEQNYPVAIPKTSYLLWKMVDGKKVYIDIRKDNK